MNNLVIQSYINEKEKLVDTVTQVYMNHSDSYSTTRNTEKHPNIYWIKERIKTIDEILLKIPSEGTEYPYINQTWGCVTLPHITNPNDRLNTEGLSCDEVMRNFKK